MRRVHFDHRLTQVLSDSSVNIASWQFFGPGRTAEVEMDNGLICSWMNNARTHSAVQPAVANLAWGDSTTDRLGREKGDATRIGNEPRPLRPTLGVQDRDNSQRRRSQMLRTIIAIWTFADRQPPRPSLAAAGINSAM